MYGPGGNCLYLVWHFGPKDRVGIRYPKRWQGYFCRPVYLFKCPMSKLLIFDDSTSFYRILIMVLNPNF